MTSTSSVKPSAKRKRVEQDEEVQGRSSTSLELERPVDFWLNDGNIVLQVEYTQFRVHRGILCLNSGFFNDMFDLPQPQNAPVVEGCPLVHCAGDSVQDWKNTLMFIYYPQKLKKPFPVSFLASMLRLGKKYQFNLIRDKAVQHMKKRIPTTFDAWNKLMNPLHPEDDPPGYFWIAQQKFDLINIAEEVGLQSILPALYYFCAVDVKTEYIFDGLLRADGTTSHLSPASQRNIIIGEGRIRALIPKQTMAWLFEDGILDGDGCLSQGKCKKERLALMKVEVPFLAEDLRNALNTYGYNLEYEPKFCPPCLRQAQKLQDDARFKVWMELPLLFNLPKWDDLKDFAV